MPRQVDLRLDALLEERAPGTSRVELAGLLGISEGTLRAYLENRWTVLDRTVLERLADFLQCDAGQLLETSESHFFDCLRNLSGKELHPGTPTCLYLRRPDAEATNGGRRVGHRDFQAAEQIEVLFRDCVDGIAGVEKSSTTPSEFEKDLIQNCVVIGSPRFNPAAEMAVCRSFGAEPFRSTDSTKLPFIFKVGDVEASPSSVLEKSSDGKRGIWLREANELVEVDYWPAAEFKRRRISRGRDCGVVIVLNHQPEAGASHYRKLVVLSGFGGTGTAAAARALVQHYRDFEPDVHGAPVWGLLEVFYNKSINSTERRDLSYNWRYRVGGRCPVPFVSR